MIPYSDLTYFLLVFVLLLPVILRGWQGKPFSSYTMFLSLFLAVVIYFPHNREIIALVAYLIFQWGVYSLFRTIYFGSYGCIKKYKNFVYYVTVLLSILPLIMTKVAFLSFFAKYFLGFEIKTIGFLGISYITFKCVQIIIETKDGLIKDFKVKDYISFLLFFPTISSGPIDRSRRFLKDFYATLSKENYREMLYIGINKVFRGLLYKFIISKYIYDFWIVNISKNNDWLSVLSYMYGYSFYLFFDFAGYSLLAIGVGYILGIRIPENFNSPFISKNIKDFWNRWHISLSFWFRDFVYMRMVIFLTKKRYFKYKYAPSFLGYFTLFLLMGLWHGIELHYLLYGLYHAFLMIGYDFILSMRKKYPKNRILSIGVEDNLVNSTCSVIITFNIICFGFLIFSGKII